MTARDYLVEIETLPPRDPAPSAARSHPLGTIPIGVILPAESAIGAPNLLRLATREWYSRPDDAPANIRYAGLVTQPLAYERSTIDGDSPVGRLGVGGGDIELVDPKGFLDATLNEASLVGRGATVRSVPRGQGLAAAQVEFAGVVDALERGRRIRVGVVTADALAGDFDNLRFAGTGGAEGGADLAGKAKPASFGYVFGIPAIYLGLIAGRHSYVVSGGKALPILSVPAVYDRGELIPQVAFPPAAGQASVDLATGIVTLGGAAAGRLTCDVQGYAPGGVLVATTAKIIEAILKDFQGTDPAAIDAASLAQLDLDQPAPIGLWVGAARTSAVALIQDLRRGATLWGGARRDGRWAFGQLKMPAGPALAGFDRANATIRRVPAPASMDPPAFRHEVGWARNYTVTDDVSSAASDAQRAFMAEEFRTAPYEDLDIRFRHPTSRPRFTRGLFRDQADAAAEAARKAILFDGRRLYQVRTDEVPVALDIGGTVALTEPDFGHAATLGTVVRLALDRRAHRDTLTVFA